MPAIAFEVAPNLGRWAVMHEGLPLATFATQEQAERAALAVAIRHPQSSTAKVDVNRGDDIPSSIHIY